MPRTVLLLLFGDIGDTVLTIPAIRAIRERYPGARLLLMSKPLPGSIVQKLGLVDEIIDVDKHLFDRPADLLRPAAAFRLLGLWRRLRRERIDTVVLFHHLVTSWGALKFGLLCMASGARERLGIDNGRGWFLTRSVPDLGFGARHEAEYRLAVAGLLGAPGTLDLEFPVEDADRVRARALLQGSGLQGQRFFAVYPGAGPYGPGRKWPAERFAETARRVAAEHGVRPVIVGTDTDRVATDRVMEVLGDSAVNLTGKTGLGVLAAVLEQCEVLIANDGGVGHVAAAVGTPVVSVFGPSNDRAWRPLGSTVVAADLGCRPCFYRDIATGLPDGCATHECLALVTPRDVVRAVGLAIGAAVAV
jgi:ADP-heptose:LPS heptosyltransferase